MAVLLKLFQKIEEEGTLPYLFMMPALPWYKNRKRHYEKRKQQANITDKYSVKILNKILPNQIQQHIKKIIHHDQAGLIPGM